MKSTKHIETAYRPNPTRFANRSAEEISKYLPKSFVAKLKSLLHDRKLDTTPKSRAVDGVAYRSSGELLISCSLYTKLGDSVEYTDIERDAIAAMRAYHLGATAARGVSGKKTSVRVYVVAFD